MRIDEIEKPQWEWCAHCDIDQGCKIYFGRPSECQTYLCGYLYLKEISEDWYPRTSKMVVEVRPDAREANIYVDPAYPDAWLGPLYYADVKRWAGEALTENGRLYVRIQSKVIAIFPDRDVDLGDVSDDETIVAVACPTPGRGTEAFVYKKKRGEANKGPAFWR